MQVQIEVRPADLSDLDRASVVLGEAFADYAWTIWTVDPDVPAISETPHSRSLKIPNLSR